MGAEQQAAIEAWLRGITGAYGQNRPRRIPPPRSGRRLEGHFVFFQAVISASDPLLTQPMCEYAVADPVFLSPVQCVG